MRINKSLRRRATISQRSNNDLSIYELRNINDIY